MGVDGVEPRFRPGWGDVRWGQTDVWAEQNSRPCTRGRSFQSAGRAPRSSREDHQMTQIAAIMRLSTARALRKKFVEMTRKELPIALAQCRWSTGIHATSTQRIQKVSHIQPAPDAVR